MAISGRIRGELEYCSGVGLVKSVRRFFLIFLGVLVFSALVHADMMPVSQECAVCRQSPVSCTRPILQHKDCSCQPVFSDIPDLDLWSVGFSLEDHAEIGQTTENQQLHSLTDGHNSLEFCLSALISLGLCCSAQRARRLPLGFVPGWYHQGGPFQIGHSFAVTPETLYPTPACCFAQPDCTEDNHLPRYCIKTVISLWRKSQFTPAVLASRGPPAIS